VRSVPGLWPAFVVGGIVLGAGGLAALFAARATHWAVMSDELQTSKLATSIADSGSILPQIHGHRYGALAQQLYPLLLSPWFAWLGVPDAVHAAHIFNGFLLASAAVPAYLLARDVTGSRVAGCVTALLSAFVPWLVLSATLLTENAAYPAFVWALLLCQRALARPATWRDVGALAGLLLAYLARTQLFVLAVAFPLVILLHELGYHRRPEGQSRLAAVRVAVRRSVSSHPLLAAVYGIGAGVVVVLAAAGRLGGIFGNYVGTVHGDLFPAGIWGAAGDHLAYVVVAVGIAPFLLAASWAVVTVVFPRRREAHAYAVLTLVVTPLLLFEVTSFDLRFTPGAFVQDRYLFYLVALAAPGAAAAFLEPERRRERAVLVLAACGLFAGLASAASFSGATVIFWASPASAFHPALAVLANWLGLSAGSLVVVGTVLIGVVLAALLVRAPPLAGLAALAVGVGALGAFEAVYVFDRFAVPATTVARPIPDAPADWIDAANPGREPVTLVPSPYLAQEFWWDAEFWNRSVDDVLRIGRGPTFTPFPAETLAVDPKTGRVSGLETDLLVETSVETRFQLSGARPIAGAPPLLLTRVPRPYRAEWTTAGADADGWTRPHRPVTVLFYPTLGRGRFRVTAAVSPPPGLKHPLRVLLRSGGVTVPASVARHGPSRLSFSVCLPAGRPARATLTPLDGRFLADGRVVGPHLDAIATRPTGKACRPDAAAG
jgi:hypothetical protein